MPAPSSLSSVTSLVLAVAITIDGNAVNDAVSIANIKISHEINRVSSAEVELITLTGKAADHGFLTGSKIDISAGYSADNITKIFSGVIVKTTMSIDSASNYKWVVNCRHKVIKMTVGKVKANYSNVTDSGCINELLQTNYSDISATVKASSITHEMLVQNNTSDWDFMLARTDFLGYIVCLDADSVSIAPPVLTSSEGTERITLGESILSFNMEINAEKQPPSLTATAWDKKEGSDNTVTATEPVFSSKMIKMPGSFLTQPQKIVTSTPLAQEELQAWADGRLLRVRMAAYKGQLTIVGNAAIKTGDWIELAGVGDDYSGLVIVSSVGHSITAGNWKTTIKTGLEDVQAHEKANFNAPVAAGLVAGIHGLQRATVTKLEQDPANEFRIQVQTQPSTGDGQDNIWARIAGGYATSGAGTFFMPEMNDEVVLGFLENDPGHPIVIGSLYSSTNAAPVVVKDTNYIKMVCTKNKLKLTFDDEKKVITVETPGANKIVISDDGKSIEITDQSSNAIKMTTDGINIESKKNITIKADGDISLTSNTGKISLAASAGDIAISGNNISETANIEYKANGNAAAQISSSGTMTVKGIMVLIN